MRGNLGQPPGGWPPPLQKKILKGEAASTARPGAVMPPADLDKLRAEAEKLAREGESIDDEDFNGYLMYPKVFSDYFSRHREYGPVRTLPTPVYFYGMQPGQEVSIEIDPGMTLEVRLQAVGETNEEGDVRVFFELNGQPRTVRVPNRKAQASAPKRPKAESGNPDQVAAPMPGVIASVAVTTGQPVHAGDLMLTIEAMKMETGLYADRTGTVKAVHVQPGAQVDAKDLLVEIAAA
jgi:pyruvate carboxylase